jgi:hypothetical protein
MPLSKLVVDESREPGKDVYKATTTPWAATKASKRAAAGYLGGGHSSETSRP